MRNYEYRYVIGFEDTNLVGNVYYVNHFRWQGRCRELFLREHAPTILDALTKNFALATVRCSCEYLEELVAFDEISLRMSLLSQVQNRISLNFDYYRILDNSEQLVARGRQEIACMLRVENRLVPTPVPDELRIALRPFTNS